MTASPDLNWVENDARTMRRIGSRLQPESFRRKNGTIYAPQQNQYDEICRCIMGRMQRLQC
jgi:hypothetical protein